MSAKILTSTLIGLDAFRQDPLTALQQAEKGTLAVLDNYAPVMYAITPKRLAELLALEAAARQPNDVALDDSLYDDSPPRSIRRQAEGRMFHHVQWQQKLARSIQMNRAANGGQPKRDITQLPDPDRTRPKFCQWRRKLSLAWNQEQGRLRSEAIVRENRK
ncbi:unnamed protein product [Peronospora farinosa]|uniref:Uncharacterized protein n=1 Tax=Peronospora farinosa TaxID=134698 RepID=A0ABN8CE38_9STRA|nr:unnamed protein product [Peronospora farinosa]